jgi:predicted alpha/beta-fold hydrolase
VLIFISELEWLWSKPIGWSRETVVSDVDGQDLMLDWATHGYSEEDESHVDSDAPIVLMIHGLGDNRNIAYIKRFARHCEERGWKVMLGYCRGY